MKKYPSIVTALFLMLIVVACNNSNKENKGSNGIEADLDDAISKAESRRAADPNASGGNTCLFSYQEKYDQLLTEEMVLNTTGFSKDALEIEYSKGLKNPEYHSIAYRFANKRVGKPAGVDFKMEMKDHITLSRINKMSLNQFKDIYTIISKQETADAHKAIDDAVEGKSESEEANKKAKELEQMGVSKETTKGATDMLKDAFAKNINSYVNVDGLGDAATWNTFTNELNVLKDGIQFKLTVDVNNDNKESKKVAIATAQKILEKCN